MSASLHYHSTHSTHSTHHHACRVQGPQRCLGSCSQSTAAVAAAGGGAAKADASPGADCFRCHEPDVDNLDSCSIALDLGNARSAPGIDLVPTFTTSNKRICLLLATGQMGMLRIEDAERLQVRCVCCACCACSGPRTCQLECTCHRDLRCIAP